MRHARIARILLAGVQLVLACATASALLAGVRPEPLPDPQISGFEFPVSEASLLERVSAMARGDAPARTAVLGHAWGLWTAATLRSGQVYERQRLRVFETWASTEDLLGARTPADLTAPRTNPRRLGPLRLRELRAEAPDPEPVIGTVKFDPSAAAHIVRQRLLEVSALRALLEGGAVQVPPFPATALVVKPVYEIVHVPAGSADGYYRLNVWTGPPATPQSWGPDRWSAAVWIDIAGRGDAEGRGDFDATPAANGESRTRANTYALSDFIHHRLSAADAAALNETRPEARAQAGDIALLTAMHVAGRELARWTWQTFWWTPDADSPPEPSSREIAAARPAELQDAPRHYAMSLAYTMLTPDEPFTGGANAAPAVYAYNPYIEARLGPLELPDSQPGFAPDGSPAANNVGVQTNCLSCHLQATYHPPQHTAPRFTGARYVDLGDPSFVGTLQTELLWALPRHAR